MQVPLVDTHTDERDVVTRDGAPMRMHRCMALVAMLLLACTHVDAQSRDATGALAGCVTDTTGHPMPGVKIDVSAKGVHRTLSSRTSPEHATCRRIARDLRK